LKTGFLISGNGFSNSKLSAASIACNLPALPIHIWFLQVICWHQLLNVGEELDDTSFDSTIEQWYLHSQTAQAQDKKLTYALISELTGPRQGNGSPQCKDAGDKRLGHDKPHRRHLLQCQLKR
jgi:hypothetical protein